MLDRRMFLTTAGAGLIAAPAILRAQSQFRSFPFSLGIASGDPSTDGFVLWTRLAPDPDDRHGGMGMAPMDVEWEVATDDRFAQVVKRGTAVARPEVGHSVHVIVDGLQPGRPYFYRFTAGGERSFRGRARTLPLANAAIERLRFAVAGCQNYEDGYFTAWRHMARDEELGFVYHYGDYIYEYRGSPTRSNYFTGGLTVPVRQHDGQDAFDLADYRQRYAQYKRDPDLQRAHAAHTFLMSYDDHEVANNWVQDIEDDAPRDLFRLRRAAALQAWWEHMPLRASPLAVIQGGTMYRGFRWGTLAELAVLDTRLFRSDQPCDDGFKPLCDGVRDPQATVLGAEQERWLDRALGTRDTRWVGIAQQIMAMSLDRRRRTEEPTRIGNMDSWAGYEVPRQRLLAGLARRGNAVVLTGDEHQNFAGDLVHRDRVVASEFVATSISSGGDGSDLRPGSEQFMAFNPELKFVNDQRGYVVCDVTADRWGVDFMTIDRVSRPDARLNRRARAEVAYGTPGLRMTDTTSVPV